MKNNCEAGRVYAVIKSISDYMETLKVQKEELPKLETIQYLVEVLEDELGQLLETRH